MDWIIGCHSRGFGTIYKGELGLKKKNDLTQIDNTNDLVVGGGV